jgi:F420-non-reducing hydrogenase small subunit
MPDKPKVALYWCASCGGCEESVVDLAEDILGVVNAVDIVFWPVAMDFKKQDVEAIKDGGILVSMINGGVRTSEQEEMAKLLRRKSALVVAYGSCAHMGGIPGLANQFDREQILRTIYEESPSTINEGHLRPKTAGPGEGHPLTIPDFRSMVRTLDQVIPVDYYLPGCPPVPRMLKAALETLLSGKLPPKGTVLGPDIAMCEECPRKESKPADLAYAAFRRPHEVIIQPETCLLAQGVICMGPATRGGCGAQCVTGNMPCSGCFGPTSHVRDQGAKILSAIASSVSAKDTEGIDRTLASIPDPIGTFYRYGLPGSLLRRKIADHN